jgi:eukaryotic-like serine/threonine-protein kinase
MASENAFPQSWSRGGFLAYFLNREMTRRDIFVLPLGSGSRESIPIAQSEADEHSARFSPDGRWIAYVSNETGRLEVYVQPFPPNAGRWQVSVDGGDEPAWSADGRELFYLGLDGLLTTVSVTAAGPTFRVSSPKPLFRTGRPLGAPSNRYDVSPNGRRFLILSPAAPPPPPEPITVLVNWIEHSKQRTFSHPVRQNTP